MDKARIGQIYGYLVCLIAVVTFLIRSTRPWARRSTCPTRCTARATAPTRGSQSFEVYRVEMQQRGTLAPVPAGAAAPAPADTAELRAAFEAAREDHIRSVQFQARRELATSGLLVVVAAALFIVHWVLAEAPRRRARVSRQCGRRESPWIGAIGRFSVGTRAVDRG